MTRFVGNYAGGLLPDPYTSSDQRDIIANSLIGIVTVDESDDDTLDGTIPVGDAAVIDLQDTSASDSESMFIVVAGIAIIIAVVGMAVLFRKMRHSAMTKK